jgi:hypothetical protein
VTQPMKKQRARQPDPALGEALLLDKLDRLQTSIDLLNKDVRAVQDIILESRTTKRVLVAVVATLGSLGAGILSTVIWAVNRVLETGLIR